MGSLRQGLVGEYLFSGNAGDTSGFGHHGRVEGVTLSGAISLLKRHSSKRNSQPLFGCFGVISKSSGTTRAYWTDFEANTRV